MVRAVTIPQPKGQALMRWPQERLRRAADAVSEYLRHEPVVLDSTIIAGIALSAAIARLDDVAERPIPLKAKPSATAAAGVVIDPGGGSQRYRYGSPRRGFDRDRRHQRAHRGDGRHRHRVVPTNVITAGQTIAIMSGTNQGN